LECQKSFEKYCSTSCERATVALSFA